MKKMMIATVLVVTLILTSMPVFAQDGTDAPMMIADVIIVRPVSLVAIVLGTAAFIVALPFAIPSDSVDPVARALVVAPFKYTFTRPVGEFGMHN